MTGKIEVALDDSRARVNGMVTELYTRLLDGEPKLRGYFVQTPNGRRGILAAIKASVSQAYE